MDIQPSSEWCGYDFIAHDLPSKYYDMSVIDDICYLKSLIPGYLVTVPKSTRGYLSCCTCTVWTVITIMVTLYESYCQFYQVDSL